MSLRYPCPRNTHASLAPGHSGFHARVVGHLSELTSTPDGSKKRDKFGCDAQEPLGHVCEGLSSL